MRLTEQWRTGTITRWRKFLVTAQGKVWRQYDTDCQLCLCHQHSKYLMNIAVWLGDVYEWLLRTILVPTYGKHRRLQPRSKWFFFLENNLITHSLRTWLVDWLLSMDWSVRLRILNHDHIWNLYCILICHIQIVILRPHVLLKHKMVSRSSAWLWFTVKSKFGFRKVDWSQAVVR